MLLIYGEAPTHKKQRRQIGDFQFCSVICTTRTDHWRFMPNEHQRDHWKGRTPTSQDIWHSRIQTMLKDLGEEWRDEVTFQTRKTSTKKYRRADIAYNFTSIEIQNSSIEDLEERLGDTLWFWDKSNWIFNRHFIQEGCFKYIDADGDWEKLSWTQLLKDGLPDELTVRYSELPLWANAIAEPETNHFRPNKDYTREQARTEVIKWWKAKKLKVESGGFDSEVYYESDIHTNWQHRAENYGKPKKLQFRGIEVGTDDFYDEMDREINYRLNNKQDITYDLHGWRWHDKDFAKDTDFWFHVYGEDKDIFDHITGQYYKKKEGVEFDECFYKLETIHDYSLANKLGPNSGSIRHEPFTFTLKRHSFEEMVEEIKNSS